ncbi:hypothetical protein E5Z49_10690 [Listeria monocytogenes]|uniref:Uncharacterized protein n=1 Tax=Listeria monocytogenes TaxID=1639 RepID=A0AAN2XB55_LISMN|nr:hypothetical protein [Listeria monocytogenes]EAC7885708.1 hypothetical protein [Listeria monocytogenes]EAC8433358.1 hypothetical protein [Listeria monocytogenes]EAD7212790.1 hypothetical protein [Listeria monocytogenes]EAE0011754.1 hypothetical protein [Listeria monocytogenes]EAE6299020.1 hypothetical protein [Listeria monocytogenes]
MNEKNKIVNQKLGLIQKELREKEEELLDLFKREREIESIEDTLRSLEQRKQETLILMQNVYQGSKSRGLAQHMLEAGQEDSRAFSRLINNLKEENQITKSTLNHKKASLVKTKNDLEMELLLND